jgi:XTP/dITP diphosphohydrolase
MEKLIIASKNKGKINEIKDILKELPFEIISMQDAGYDFEIEENGKTFDENAMLKAQALFQHTGCRVLADDSGLEIDFLNGAPGIYTARFAGEQASQQEKNAKITGLLSGVDSAYRTARFVCSIAFVSREVSFTVNGAVEGIIAEKPDGAAGFGYDPIFFMPEYAKTMAQLPESSKNKVSHRARALNKLREELERIYMKK